MKLSFYLILILILVSCNGSAEQEGATEADGGATSTPLADSSSPDVAGGIGYNLSAPARTYILPDQLNEISGMQHLGNHLIASVQDEKGVLYFFDTQEGKLVQEIKWGKKGDYEGIAGDAEALYVLESGGKLYRISALGEGQQPVVHQWKLKLEKGCDAEGLYLLKDENLLLIACKEGTQGIRNIWAFDLLREKLRSTPFLQIPQEALENELAESGLDRMSLGLKKILDAGGESGILAPSGIARHPLNGDFYILSSQSKLLVVISSAGEIKYVEELKTSFFQQAESITFSPEGDMFIGNEVKGDKPNILRFKYDK